MQASNHIEFEIKIKYLVGLTFIQFTQLIYKFIYIFIYYIYATL